MAINKINLYGFVSDTAFYSKEFLPGPISVNSIDQGACCVSDKIENMFGDVKYIADPRSARLALPYISDCDPSWTDDTSGVRAAIMDPEDALKGSMCLLVDNKAVDSEILSNALKGNKAADLFHAIELVLNYQLFKSNVVTEVNNDALNDKMSALGISSVTISDFATDTIEVPHVYYKDVESLRKVRKWIELVWNPSENLRVTLKLWADSAAFVADYPVSTITDVIFPCPCDKLFNLCDEYTSVTKFATEVSASKGSIFNISSEEYVTRDINKLLASDDHTGVKDFPAKYYAYPDTANSIAFDLTFWVVYKGAEPTNDAVRDAIRAAVMSIGGHSEEEWTKKLPGIISSRIFYIVPMYSDRKVGGVEIRKGIIDITPTSIEQKISDTLGSTLAAYAQYAQVINDARNEYPLLVVPSTGNPSTSRLLLEIFPDFAGVGDADVAYDTQSTSTKQFAQYLDQAVKKAYINDGSALAEEGDGVGLDKRFVTFNAEGITFYVICNHNS